MRNARYLAVYLPRFACDWLVRHHPGLRGQVLVTIAKEQGGLTVMSASRRAMQAGVTEGMRLADARAIEPALEAWDADPARDGKALGAMADWCERYTPLVSLDPPHGLFLDITGCAHLFNGEQALASDVALSLRQIGYEAYAGVAGTTGAAWAAARYFGRWQAPVTIIPDAETRPALEKLPVAALRLPEECQTTLQRLGLRRIGDLYAIPRSALGKRFGAAVLQRLDQALGELDEPLSPRRPAPHYAVRQAFAEAISSPDSITVATRSLIERLCNMLGEDGRGLRSADLVWWHVDGNTGRLSIGTSTPVNKPKPLLRLLAERLDRLDPGFGIEAMALHATCTDRMPERQDGLEQAGTRQADLAGLVDSLANKLGPEAVRSLLPQQSWIPERAVLPRSGRPRGAPSTWQADRCRPLRMLPRPLPVEAVAVLPDEPPSLLRWRGQAHRIVQADGPERIEGEWWRETVPYRDYYRVEDEHGHRYWVYRAGPYQPDCPPQWYLHGMFA